MVYLQNALRKMGLELSFVLEEFNEVLKRAKYNVGHNIGFDINVVGSEFYRKDLESPIHDLLVLDTMKSGVDFCALPGGKGGKFKFPKLEELHQILFEEGFDAAHNASADVEATARCFFEMIRRDVITLADLNWSNEDLQLFKENNPEIIQAIGLNIQPYSPLHEEVVDEEADVIDEYQKGNTVEQSSSKEFFHVHNHSQYSILQSTTEVSALVKRAKELNMPAVAFSDHGNLFGAFQFINACEQNDILGIVGVELNVCKDHKNKTQKDNGFPTVFLAKNKNGYKNLIKLCSMAYTDGFYYLPRVDRNLVEAYKTDLLVISGGIFGEIPSLIFKCRRKNRPRKSCIWWKECFGDDFYLEINRHNLPEEERINGVLQKFASKHNIKLIAANNTYYLDKKDADAHDILLCVKDAEKPINPKKNTRVREEEIIALVFQMRNSTSRVQRK